MAEKLTGTWETHLKFVRENPSKGSVYFGISVLKRILGKSVISLLTEFSRLKKKSSGRFCERYNESSSSIKNGEYFDELSNHKILNIGSE